MKGKVLQADGKPFKEAYPVVSLHGSTTPFGAETLADLGAWFGNHEKYECATEALASSLQMDPAQKDLPHVVFLLAASLYFSGDLVEATAAFQEAEKLGYRHEKLNSLLATALDRQKEFVGAAAQWRKVLEFEPESTEALDALSNDLSATERYDELILLLEAPRIRPQRTVTQYLALAAAYSKLDKPEQAAENFRNFLNQGLEVATRIKLW